jgi:hypothetical protein
MPHVSPNGCLAAEKLRSDLDVVEAACHQDEHLVLAIGEGATSGVSMLGCNGRLSVNKSELRALCRRLGSCYPREDCGGARCNTRCRSSACLRRPVVPSRYDLRSSMSSCRSLCVLTRWFRNSSQSTDAGHKESCEWCRETSVMGACAVLNDRERRMGRSNGTV